MGAVNEASWSNEAPRPSSQRSCSGWILSAWDRVEEAPGELLHTKKHSTARCNSAAGQRGPGIAHNKFGKRKYVEMGHTINKYPNPEILNVTWR